MSLSCLSRFSSLCLPSRSSCSRSSNSIFSTRALADGACLLPSGLGRGLCLAATRPVTV